MKTKQAQWEPMKHSAVCTQHFKPGPTFSKMGELSHTEWITRYPVDEINRLVSFRLFKAVAFVILINTSISGQELDNGVMTTPKRCSVLSFIFTCLRKPEPLKCCFELSTNTEK